MKNFKTTFSFSVPVKLREVHLKPNNVANTDESGFSTTQEVIFYCFPMLDGIVDPHTVVIDVEWWVEDQLVIEESFNLKARSSGILQPQFWKMGQTVRIAFVSKVVGTCHNATTHMRIAHQGLN